MRATIIDPGLLRTELALESAVLTPDGQGGDTVSLSELALLFGHIEPIGARDERRASRDVQETTHRVTVRYRTGIEPGMRFRRLSRFFEIRTVHDPDETGRFLICMTAEVYP